MTKRAAIYTQCRSLFLSFFAGGVAGIPGGLLFGS
jgi:hypothetical protein